MSTSARALQVVRVHLALVGSQPTERALLALGEADPVLDARGLNGVQQMLALKRKIRLKDEHKLAVAEHVYAPYRR